MKMPKPDNKHGYSEALLRRWWGDERLKRFLKWMEGQACADNDYSIDSDKWQPVYFRYDVERFYKADIKDKSATIYD